MTEARIRELYELVRCSIHSLGHSAAVTESLESQLERALDQIIDESDPMQAGLVDWAMGNGCPEFETVLKFGKDS